MGEALPIPHREPFLFVGTATDVDSEGGVFRWDFPRTGDSFALRMCPSLLMVEAMAQAAAAWHGLFCASAGGEVEHGTLASIDGARFSGRPHPGDCMITKVRQKKVFGALVMLDGEVWVHHRLLAQAKLVVRRGAP